MIIDSSFISEIKDLIEKRQLNKVREIVMDMQEADIAELLDDYLEVKEALIIYRLLSKEIAASVFSYMDVDRQSEFAARFSDTELHQIIDELYFDDMIDLIEEVPANLVKKILRITPQSERALINQFLNYPDDSAGSMMTIEFVDLKKESTVHDAMERIKKIALDKETIYTTYITDSSRVLEGIVSLKNLVLADSDAHIKDIMNEDYLSVYTEDDQEMISKLFQKYDLLSLPVVDKENRLVGIITIDDVVDVIEEEATEDMQKMAAIAPSEDEYLSMSPFELAKKRIVWLIILMFSAIFTEAITNGYEELRMQFLMLGTVVPMLMSTGGNAGAQSSTLVIRGITLGDIRFTDIFKVAFKEMRVGILIGGTLGVLNFTRIFFVEHDIKLAIIVGITLLATTTTAALIGGLLPILAKKINLDPAIMANPLIATINDATTLLIFYAIASLILLNINI